LAAVRVTEQGAVRAGRHDEEDAMDVFQTMAARYSVRAYKTDAVEDDKLAQVLEAARLAPTASNRQPFRLIVARTAGREEELRRVYSRPWFTAPPLVLAVVAVPAEAWRRMDGKPYDEVDATIAMDHVVLAATALGLGTCWVAAFDPAAAREVLGLPDDVEPIAFTPLGYAADAPGQKKRRPLGELVKYDRW
jgi:nitroreductase